MDGSTETRPFPRPFGGIVVEYDFPITLVFTIGFGIASCINAYSFTSKGTRSFIKMASLSLSLERIISNALRMLQARRTNYRTSWGITEYLQMTYSVGFLSLLEEQLAAILCAATSATRDGLTFDEWIVAAERNPALMQVRKAERHAIRKWVGKMDLCINALLSFQVAIALQSEFSDHNIGTVWPVYLRFISNVAGFLIPITLLSMIHHLQDLEGINQAALHRIKVALIALSLIPLSRCFLSFETATTLETSPSDPGTIAFKVVFYVFQLLPELFTCLLTALTNYRALCDSGMWGDWPRSRIERGLSPNLSFLKVLKPYRGPLRLYFWICQFRWCMQDSLSDEDEGVPLKAPSTGWKSSTLLADADKSHDAAHTDVEKQSIWSFSSTARSTSEAGSTARHSSLVIDVNIWRPQLPPAFSFDADVHI